MVTYAVPMLSVVLVLKDKNITIQETQFIEILHTVPG